MEIFLNKQKGFYMKINYNNYDCIVGYGIGQNYERIKNKVRSKVRLDYLYDKKWENSKEIIYDGLPVLSKEEFLSLKNPLIIIMAEMAWVIKSIVFDLSETGYTVVEVNKIIEKQLVIKGNTLKEKFPDGKYQDSWGNRIFFDHTLSDEITIYLKGENNELRIEKNVEIGGLQIYFGNNGYCNIGEDTKIMYANIFILEGKVLIGRDCLLAGEICIRNHDSHHIFDVYTHERINYSKDIIIGNQVWLAQRVTLLGGAEIGTGSVVGTNAVTSSKFGEHQIIVGSPARVIKDNICWSKDDTDWFNRTCLEECISQEALKYL